MMSNFLLSELQKEHQKTQLRLSAVAGSTVDVGQEVANKGSVNGFTLHLRNLMSSRVPLGDETAEMVRKRVWNEAVESWRDLKLNNPAKATVSCVFEFSRLCCLFFSMFFQVHQLPLSMWMFNRGLGLMLLRESV